MEARVEVVAWICFMIDNREAIFVADQTVDAPMYFATIGPTE